ncbi:MAG: ATP-binding cassette domain-containing protein [Rhodobacteraceae bacterium]|nr:ATP-binding cassette domain-containing protein [Paracoccaceae bacterium]
MRGQLVRLPDVALRGGDALALTGPSGAGKSTALAAIAGLTPIASGRIDVCGLALSAETADAWRARIAMVPQGPHFPDVPLGDWLDIAKSGRDPWPALRKAGADGIVTRLPEGLETRLGETGGGVSGGEARRLLLARAILTGSDLILADEPTADLDRETAERIIEALCDRNVEGCTVIVATHDPDLAVAMGRQVALTA